MTMLEAEELAHKIVQAYWDSPNFWTEFIQKYENGKYIHVIINAAVIRTDDLFGTVSRNLYLHNTKLGKALRDDD